MAIELNITPEDIDQIVKTSLIEAGLGKAISNAVADSLSGYDNPIKNATRYYVGRLAEKMIEELYGEQLRSAVKEKLAEYFTSETIDNLATRTIREVVSAASR